MFYLNVHDEEFPFAHCYSYPQTFSFLAFYHNILDILKYLYFPFESIITWEISKDFKWGHMFSISEYVINF